MRNGRYPYSDLHCQEYGSQVLGDKIASIARSLPGGAGGVRFARVGKRGAEVCYRLDSMKKRKKLVYAGAVPRYNSKRQVQIFRFPKDSVLQDKGRILFLQSVPE
ncbi:hypothetical protein CEXT_366261 [Caerostris extrusa]|uniref:Uncharacterized protein n=1 Tax=Caerostris extrusa TaxID=172846 RepID=A0AAV4PAS9_CAEEX|nr:hypothetical protein CEXT_366261 [Caerostris extrusa]